MTPDFADLLTSEPDADLFDALRSAEGIGRLLGLTRFLARIVRQTSQARA
jgi:putative transposase